MTAQGAPLSVGALPGWSGDDHRAALEAYERTADLLPPGWPRPDGAAESFFRSRFRCGPGTDALLTGYYEPELPGAEAPDAIHRFPLFAPPPDLRPDRPWRDRAAIEQGRLLAGLELVWLDSPLEAFLAQVQGSVRVRLGDGRLRRFGYAGKNGHPYVSIGKELIRRGALDPSNASVAAIRDWAARHPGDLPGLLRVNPSFVFFREIKLATDLGPLGTMQRPVTPMRTLAVDPDHIPLGAPVWVEWPGRAMLMIAQDTGSAIKGLGRGDIFFGSGKAAGDQAGALLARGRVTPLVPKDAP